MGRYLHDLQAALTAVFAQPSYIALASVLATAAFLFAVWFPNVGLIGDIFATPGIAFTAKLNVALSLLGGIATNFSLFSAGYTVAIAALFGVNAAMVVYVVMRQRAAPAGKGLAVGAGGMASGALGIGCAACGSLLTGSMLSSFAAAGALAVLPLAGGELGILGVALLLASLSLIGRTIAASASCTLDAASQRGRHASVRSTQHEVTKL